MARAVGADGLSGALEAAQVFDEARHAAFIALSGDSNPLHADAAGARRGYFGERVVHGVHLALWALEALSVERPAWAARVTLLDARFERPVYPGERVTLRVDTAAIDRLELSLWLGGLRVTTLRLALGAEPVSPTLAPSATPVARPVEAPDLAVEALASLSGETDAWTPPGAAETLFPTLTRLRGSAFVGALCALSRVVGMQCPGRRALFSTARVSGLDGPLASEGAFAVRRARPHLSMVDLEVTLGSMSAVLRALVIPPPPPAPTAWVAQGRMPPDAFRGRNALVLGGSRGLGATAALLLAASGARVCVTWRAGRDEAEHIAAEARSLGADCVTCAFDSAAPEALPGALAAIPGAPFVPDVVLYFPTPRIFTRRADPFDAARFAAFAQVYVVDFARVVDTLVSAFGSDFALLTPSTSALDVPVPELLEYAAAKAAAEQVVSQLERRWPKMRCVTPRLPRVATDQTVSLVETEAAHAVDALRPHLLALVAPIAHTERELPP